MRVGVYRADIKDGGYIDGTVPWFMICVRTDISTATVLAQDCTSENTPEDAWLCS